MTPTARCFIALDLSDALKEKIRRAQETASSSELGIRWVKPENLHLTLKFLGDVKLQKIDEVIHAINALGLPQESLRLSFNKVGIFPDGKHPRIIWLGSDEVVALLQLVTELENEMSKIGFAKEKRDFKSHITIGRTKPNHDAKGIVDWAGRATKLLVSDEHIKRITLYKSRLSSDGPHYEALHQRAFTL